MHSYERKTKIRYLLNRRSKKFQNLPERVFIWVRKMSKTEGNQKLKFFKPSDLAWNARPPSVCMAILHSSSELHQILVLSFQQRL